MSVEEVLQRTRLKLSQGQITRYSVGVAIVRAGDEVGIELAAHAFGILAIMLKENIVDWSEGRSMGEILGALDRAIALAREELNTRDGRI